MQAPYSHVALKMFSVNPTYLDPAHLTAGQDVFASIRPTVEYVCDSLNNVAHDHTFTGIISHIHIGNQKIRGFSDVMDGNVSVLYTSPEAILDRRRPWWHAVLERQRDRICVIAVDEVHCMLSWYVMGCVFRPPD